MMTGCYPPRIGFGAFEGRLVLFPGHAVGLNPEEITVARLLSDSGYATKLVGKWHCGDQPEFLPTRHGFDSYYGIPYSNDMGRQREDDTWPPLPLVRDEAVIQEQPDQAALTERYVEESVRFIRENRERPFFLYLAHMYIHLPIYPPAHFMRESQNGRYGAAVSCVDWATDVLFHELSELGLDENTLVIFTSDNGSRCRDEGGSNDPLRGTKGTTWEGGQRVPCLMRWPAGIQAGTECRALTTAMDLCPTLAELGGTSMPSDRVIDGKSIVPLMASDGSEPSPHEAFFYYRANNLEAVRNARWKLHVRKGDEVMCELYDLLADPGETNDLSHGNPGVVEELAALLDDCRQDLGDEATGVEGRNVREIGRIENPDTLTHYDPEHPYIIAMYDLKERG
jgi:arylsulfatase A-like enzyme